MANCGVGRLSRVQLGRPSQGAIPIQRLGYLKFVMVGCSVSLGKIIHSTKLVQSGGRFASSIFSMPVTQWSFFHPPYFTDAQTG